MEMNLQDLTKLAQLSKDFDLNKERLQVVINGSNVGSKCEDCVSETSEALTRLSEAVDRVEQEIKILRGAIQTCESISLLNSKLQAALSRREIPFESCKITTCTPVKEKATLPYTEEEFPTTPTLEQLGLSGPTLSIVGRRACFDSSTSLSDNEFDNSFYQKSPSGNGVDNSFSSDVSVPHFRILNSSPADKKRRSSSKNSNSRTKSHNLQQVTSSVLTDASDSSFVDSDTPSSKRVHFSEIVENVQEN